MEKRRKMIDTLKCRSSFPARFVIIGNPACRRVALFQAALGRVMFSPAHVVAWKDFLAGRLQLTDIVRPGDIVRIESPGRDFDVEGAILAAGADQADEEDSRATTFDRVSSAEAMALNFDKGRILFRRQWFLGFRAALRRIERQLADCPPHGLVNSVDSIEMMFDKSRCHSRLQSVGVPVPPALGIIDGFDDLAARMRHAGWRRVFVKLAHGSSASGVVAYQMNPDGRQQVITTVEMVQQEGRLQLYNSRRLRTYRDSTEISRLINALSSSRSYRAMDSQSRN